MAFIARTLAHLRRIIYLDKLNSRIDVYPRFSWSYIRLLPEFALIFDNNPHRDIYLHLGWLWFGWEASLCLCSKEYRNT